MKHREFERYSSILNLTNKATDWLELGFKNQMSYSRQMGRGDQTDQEQGLANGKPFVYAAVFQSRGESL